MGGGEEECKGWTSKTKGRFEGQYATLTQQKLSKVYTYIIYEGDLKGSFNNQGDVVPTGYLLSSNEGSSSRYELQLIELLAKGTPWETLNNLGYCQSCWWYSIN